jgi:hypothetical protein
MDASKETNEESGRLETDEESPPRYPPERIKAVTRPKDDIGVICLLTEAECPPLRQIRAHRKASILYLFWRCFRRGVRMVH